MTGRAGSRKDPCDMETGRYRRSFWRTGRQYYIISDEERQ